MSKDYYMKSVAYDVTLSGTFVRRGEEEMKEFEKVYKRLKYEHNRLVTGEDIEQKRYVSKTILYIDAKRTGKRHFDRSGSIDY